MQKVYFPMYCVINLFFLNNSFQLYFSEGLVVYSVLPDTLRAGFEISRRSNKEAKNHSLYCQLLERLSRS